jgi:hypothetical protein
VFCNVGYGGVQLSVADVAALWFVNGDDIPSLRVELRQGA